MRPLPFCLLLFTLGPLPAPAELAEPMVPPRVLRHRLPAVAPETRSARDEVDLWVEIDEQGRVINAAVKRATDPRLAVPCLRAIRHWRYAPALHNGAPTPTAFVQPLRFGETELDRLLGASVPARAQRRVPPTLPPDCPPFAAEITVALTVDSHGQVNHVAVVRSTGPAELNDLTLTAARQWTFRPALRNGVPVPSTVYVPFHYEPAADHARRPARPASATAATVPPRP